MQAKNWKRKKVGGSDICDALNTLPAKQLEICRWFTEKWITCDAYISWAESGLQHDSDDVKVSTFGHAKRAASRRIDELLLGHHQWRFAHANYGVKIESLRKLDIEVPEVVNDLVLTPRNIIEHAYSHPNVADVRHAVQTAKLFVQATESLTKYCSVFMVDSALLCRSTTDTFEVREIRDRPFAFFDVLDNDHLVKVVHPESEEILWADLSTLSKEHALATGRWLHSACQASSGYVGRDISSVLAIKEQCAL